MDDFSGGIQPGLLAPQQEDQGEWQDHWQRVLRKGQSRRTSTPGRELSSLAPANEGTASGYAEPGEPDKVRVENFAGPRLSLPWLPPTIPPSNSHHRFLYRLGPFATEITRHPACERGDAELGMALRVRRVIIPQAAKEVDMSK